MQDPLLDGILGDDELDGILPEVGVPEEDDKALPARRVTPEQFTQDEVTKRGFQAGGSPLNRWAGSILSSIYEGARSLRPIGIEGVSRQDKGIGALAAEFLGGQESLLNVGATDGRQLTYAEGTPEWQFQQMLTNAQNRGESIYEYLKSKDARVFMERHKLKPLRFGVDIGRVSLFPGMADTFGLFGEAAGAGINKLLGTQLFGNTENWNQMWRELAETYEVWTPEGRQRFIEALDRDPGQTISDAAMLVMLKGKMAGVTGRGVSAVGKAVKNRNTSRVGSAMQRLDTVLNEGFSVPGVAVRPELAGRRRFLTRRDREGRMQSNFGVVDYIDPEGWGEVGASQITGQAITGALSPFASEFDASYRERLRRAGIDPARAPETLMSRSQRVAQIIARREVEGHQRTVDELELAVTGFEKQFEDILAEAHESGDIAAAAKALETAFNAFDAKIRAEAKKGYDKDTTGRRDFIMSLRNTYAALYGEGGIVGESQGLEASLGTSDFDQNPILRGFDETMRRIAETGESGISPDFVAGVETGQEQTLQGGEVKSTQVDMGSVNRSNREGQAQRIMFGPTWNSYAGEYEAVPLGNIVASHTVDGAENPLFAELAAKVAGEGAQLQTRDFNQRMVRKIASNIRPEALLLDLKMTNVGAPIAIPVEHEGTVYHLVLAGNNRIEALEMARREYPSDWTLYQQELANILPDYGIDPVSVGDMDSPVLVRRLLDPESIDLSAFAAETNIEATRRQATGEQAVKDALTLDTEVLSRLNFNLTGSIGDILQDARNQDALRQWLGALEDESGDLYTEVTDPTDGSTRTELTKAGVERLENALFRKVFASERGLKMLNLFETVQNSNVKNIERAVASAFPFIAAVEVGVRRGDFGEQYAIAEQLAEAVVGAWEITRQGAVEGVGMRASISRFLSQQEMDIAGVTALVSGVSRDLLEVLDASIDRPAVVGEFMQGYRDLVSQQMTGDSLFGDADAQSQASIVYGLKDQVLEEESLISSESSPMRMAMEHMTGNEAQYRQILEDRTIKAHDPFGVGEKVVYLSMGPHYRRGKGQWGFIFSTNQLEKLGLVADYGDMGINVILGESIEDQHTRMQQNIGWSEFLLSDDLPVEHAVAVVEDDTLKIITEATRGKSPDQWQFREPTEADLSESSVHMFISTGDAMRRSGISSVAGDVMRAISEAYPKFSNFIEGRNIGRSFQLDFDNNLHEAIREFMEQEGLSVYDVYEAIKGDPAISQRLIRERGVISTEGAPRRVGMEHMTTNESTYRSILADGEIKGRDPHSDQPDSSARLVWVSMGPYYRSGSGERWGFIFSTNALEQAGVVPYQFSRDLREWLRERGLLDAYRESEFRGTHRYVQLLQQYMRESGKTLEGLHKEQANRGNRGYSEFVLQGDMDLKDAVAVVEGRVVKVITEATRGLPPDQWQFREPTEADLSREDWLSLMPDAPEALVSTEGAPRRVGMEHMTTNESTYRSILADGEIKGRDPRSDQPDSSAGLVWVSMGPYYRRHGGGRWGFIFSTNALEEVGLAPYGPIGQERYRELDAWLAERGKTFSGLLESEFDDVIMEFIKEKGITLEELHRAQAGDNNTGHSEFILRGDLSLEHVVAVVEDDQVYIITEATRGKPPDQWEVREPTAADMTQLKEQAFIESGDMGGTFGTQAVSERVRSAMLEAFPTFREFINRRGQEIGPVSGRDRDAAIHTILSEFMEQEGLSVDDVMDQLMQTWYFRDEQSNRGIISTEQGKAGWARAAVEEYLRSGKSAQPTVSGEDAADLMEYYDEDVEIREEDGLSLEEWVDFAWEVFEDMTADETENEPHPFRDAGFVNPAQVKAWYETMFDRRRREQNAVIRARQHYQSTIQHNPNTGRTVRGLMDEWAGMAYERNTDYYRDRLGFRDEQAFLRFVEGVNEDARVIEDLEVAADAWTPEDRREYILGMADTAESEDAVVQSIIDMYNQNEALARKVFEADGYTQAVGKWMRVIKQEYILDVADIEKRLQEVRVSLDRNEQIDIKGKDVAGHREIAVLAQALRHPAMEYNMVVYLTEQEDGSYVVRGHEVTSLGSPKMTTQRVFSEIEKQRQSYGPNTMVVDLHNHPSASAQFSDGDKANHPLWAKRFGNNYLGSIVINSGTYAIHWSNEDWGIMGREKNTYSTEEQIRLNKSELGWDPEWRRPQGGAQPGDWQIRRNDPMFPMGEDSEAQKMWYTSVIPDHRNLPKTRMDKNMLINGLLRFATSFKSRRNWITVAMAGGWGRLNALIQLKDFHRVPKPMRARMLRELAIQYGGAEIHIHVGRGDWFSRQQEAIDFFTEINNDALGGGIMSVRVANNRSAWINEQEDYTRRTWKGTGLRTVSTQFDPPPERARPQTTTDYTTQRTPYTYGNAEDFSTALRRKIQAMERSDTSNPQELRWYKKLRAALEADMTESLKAHRPELSDQIDAVDLAYAQGMTKMNSQFAKHIQKNMGSDLVEGTGNYRNMVMGLLNPSMDVASVAHVYELIGGFDSDAGRRLRRVFLDELFTQAQTPAGRQEAAKRRRGEDTVLKSWERVAPRGLSSALGKWQRKTGQYPAELLEAILGKETVDRLYDLDSIGLQFERMVRKLGGSQTAPWIQEWMRSDYRAERLWYTLRHFGHIFSGVGAAAGGGAGMMGAGNMASVGLGIGTFITAWLTTAGFNVFMEYMKDTGFGRRYLLEGTVAAMSHVLTGDPIFASADQHREHLRKVEQGVGVRPSRIRQARRLARVSDRDREKEE